MSRVRVLHERRAGGLLFRLEDDPDKPNNYRVAVILVREFDQYHEAMDALRNAVAEAKKGHAILCQSD